MKLREIRLRSAAKVNLTLDILSRRADGYHELASVVHTVGLWDEIEVELTAGEGIGFSCNRPELAGPDNLCVRAAKKWFEATGERPRAKIHLEKRIPTGAGLGGGSGNAAAVFAALNHGARQPLAAQKLHELGAKLGADVPLFLEGGAVLMEGIGEKLSPLLPLEGWLLIVKPEISLSTPAIYRVWDENDLKSNHDTARLLSRWPSGDLQGIGAHLGNDLERAAEKESFVPARCIAALRQTGALNAQMSGSGSACFGLFRSQTDAQEAAQTIKFELAKDVHLLSSQLFVVPFCKSGIEFLSCSG